LVPLAPSPLPRRRRRCFRCISTNFLKNSLRIASSLVGSFRNIGKSSWDLPAGRL
jgi:hypothetical protein